MRGRKSHKDAKFALELSKVLETGSDKESSQRKPDKVDPIIPINSLFCMFNHFFGYFLPQLLDGLVHLLSD